MGQKVFRICRTGTGWDLFARSPNGDEFQYEADFVISSAPIRELVASIDCPSTPPPQKVKNAADALNYRDFLIVGLIVKDREIFDDNWIYIHDPAVQVGRVQNFKSWSSDMVPEPGENCYGKEYFCSEDDPIWMRDDENLVKLASDELVYLGLAHPEDIKDGFVVRQKKAYPVYDEGYAGNVDTIRRYIAENCQGLYLVGRNGMHRYNNQDHAMMTAMLTVENIVAGKTIYDVWKVNQDAEYIEEEAGPDKSGRMVPGKA